MPRVAEELGPLAVKRLTHTGIKGNCMYAVGGVAGLYMQVTPNGGKTWVLRVLVGRKRRDIGLGGFPTVTLAQARDKAREARDMISRGIDPVEERKAAKARLILAQQRGMLFKDAVDKALAAKLDAFQNEKHRDQWRNTLDTYATPQLGALTLQEIDTAAVLRVLQPIWATKTETASRLRGRIEAVLSWATVAGHRTGENPARWAGNLKELLPAPGKIAVEGNHPALALDDASAWFADLRKREGFGARALEFAALTVTRSGEVRGATWDEIDLDRGLWVRWSVWHEVDACKVRRPCNHPSAVRGVAGKLTGFDSPSMHTMYIDKPMRGHGLMQAIARVNRVFRDKPAGLIVDYIGIAQNLKSALGQYSKSDQEQAGIDEAEAIAALLERLDVVRSMFHGLDYSNGLTGTPHQRLVSLAEALNWILVKQDEAAQRETDNEAKKAAHRRYPDAVLALSKAFALCSASDTAREVRDEVGFFQTVRAAMVKASDTSGRSTADRDLAIRQIVNGAVASTEIVDILSAAGLSSPDISILSDEFLAEVGQMEKKNLALEALRKLLNDEIRSRSTSNVIETRKFSERLEDAISRYHINAVSTVEVLQELIALAQEVRKARNRGEETGLTPEEIAFYDALADNQSAVDILGNDQLKIIAHELLMGLKANVSIDWAHRDSARARLRVLVKRVLRKYGYPPDLEDAAVRGVLAQAEALLSNLAGR